jgi:hypothetical protein
VAIPAEDRAMPGDYFWGCVESLAVALDGDQETAEQNLKEYAEQVRKLPTQKRAEISRQIVHIIGGLAQLQARLADDKGR